MSSEEIEIKYQILTSIGRKDKIHNIIEQHLYYALKENDKSSEGTKVTVDHTQKISSNNYLYTVSILLPDLPESLLKNLEQKLLDDKIECLIKLKDDSAMIECRDYYEEIFNIEMELREILFIILLDSFSSINWYNLLDEYKSELIPNESKKSKDKDIYFQKRRVNELFFLTFSQYKQLGNNDKLKTINVIDMINRHNIYNNLRHAINNRGITKTKYQDFFAKIKENLDSIEEVRNDIAHSRFIFKDNIINYSTAKEKLKTAIVDFWG